MNVVKDISVSTDSDGVLPDPSESVVRPSNGFEDRSTMNCYSRYERNDVNDHEGSCLAITKLEPLDDLTRTSELRNELITSSHTVDFEFSPPPMAAHFVRIDGGLYLQHEN